jgi:HAD superfamily hydrolase (TIGR01484 family)
MRKKRFKILILDIDGTITDHHEHALPSKIVDDAVKEAQKHLTVAVATGRPLHLARPVYTALGLKGPCVFNGGAEIIDIATEKVLHKQQLSVEMIKELVKLTLPFGCDIYYNDDKTSVLIPNAEDISKTSSKLFIQAVKATDSIHLLEALAAVEGAAAHPTPSWSEGDVFDIHVTHEHATKRYGVDRLLELLEIDKEDSIAVGDGYNDLPLMEAAGFKVAMGNAPDEVKAVADYIAPSIDEDGVAEVIERFIIP